MTLIGLTGGVGMGKSTTARFLAERGLPVVDTDQLARDVVEPGQPTLAALVEAFGTGILKKDGALDRPAMAGKVFADAACRRHVESIVHPAIRERWEATVRWWREEGRLAGVVIIPLLLETSAEGEFDVILCSACAAASQETRLLRRGWPAEQVRQRIAAQFPAARKMDAARYVIWTEGAFDVHAAQVDRVLRAMGLSSGS